MSNGARRTPITGDPVLFAPARAARPHAFASAPDAAERCPFCPGNEGDTPPELHSIGDPWRVRVFHNKYPAAEGAEVIVDSRSHDDVFATLADPAEVVHAWIERLRVPRACAWAALFRNEGREAGASILHPHAQLVPLPFVPPRIVRETEAFTSARACPLCTGIDSAGIGGDDRFSWIAPAGSILPYQQWLVPTRHVSSPADLREDEITALARLLHDASRATRAVARAWNLAFVAFENPSAHFYVEILPRLTSLAGLELGTGTFIEIVDPEQAAAELRRASQAVIE